MRFAELNENGFGVLENILDGGTVSYLIGELFKLNETDNFVRRKNTIYGVRNLLNISPPVREFSQSKTVRGISEKFLGKNAKVVRAIYFDKNADANWKVPWHQDLTIAVKEKAKRTVFPFGRAKPEFITFSRSVAILEKMLTLRFHLDDADETNGALKIIPKSHKSGRLSADEIKLACKANQTRVCSVKKGDCLIMRPLILHSSSAGSNPKNRRVIHLEFAAQDLPNGLEWYGS